MCKYDVIHNTGTTAYRKRRQEDRAGPSAIGDMHKNLMKIGRIVSEIRSQTDRRAQCLSQYSASRTGGGAEYSNDHQPASLVVEFIMLEWSARPRVTVVWQASLPKSSSCQNATLAPTVAVALSASTGRRVSGVAAHVARRPAGPVRRWVGGLARPGGLGVS